MNNQKFILAAFFLFALTSHAAAAPRNNGSSASCTMSPAQLALGQAYSGKAVGLPTGEPLNVFVTYGDGTQWAYPHGVAESDGSINLGGWPATISGITLFKVTGPTKRQNTKVYATCAVNVLAQ